MGKSIFNIIKTIPTTLTGLEEVVEDMMVLGMLVLATMYQYQEKAYHL